LGYHATSDFILCSLPLLPGNFITDCCLRTVILLLLLPYVHFITVFSGDISWGKAYGFHY
jgi:hypothetical protein